MPNPTEPTMQRESGGTATVTQLDRIEAAEGHLRHLRGEKVTRSQRAALKRVEKAEATTARELAFRTISKTEYSRMSGRQVKTLQEQAVRYGLPLSQKVIDLNELLPAFHGFLQRHAHKLSAQASDPLLAGDSSPALEKYREERYLLSKLDRQEREGSLIPREFIHGFLTILANTLRNLGHELQVKFGPDAYEMYSQTIDQTEADTNRFLESLDSKAMKASDDATDTTAAA